MSTTPPGAATAFVRLGGLGAVGFALTIFVANVAIMVPAGLPQIGASDDEVLEFFGSQGDSVALGAMFMPLAWVFATLFAAGVVAAVRASEDKRTEAWSLVGLSGLLAQNAAFAVVTALRIGMAAPDDGPASATAGLWAVHEALFTLNGTFLALALIGLSISGWRSGLTGSRLTSVGLTAAMLNMLSASITPVVMTQDGVWGAIGLAGWLLWVLWLMGFGMALARRDRLRSDSPDLRAT